MRHGSSEQFLVLVLVFLLFELNNQTDIPDDYHLSRLLEILNIKTPYLNENMTFLDLGMSFIAIKILFFALFGLLRH